MEDSNWIDRLARLLISVLIGFGVLWLMGFFSSCTRTVYVPQTSIQRDSIYLTQYKRDSIYMHDSIFQFLKADTMYIERWHKEYIERKVHDTLYVERTDTLRIPYPVEKKLSKWESFKIVLRSVPAMFLLTLVIVLPVYFIFNRKT